MPTKRYRPEEIVSKLRQVDVLSRFAQLAPRMLSSPARFRRGMTNTPSVGWATQACLVSPLITKLCSAASGIPFGVAALLGRFLSRLGQTPTFAMGHNVKRTVIGAAALAAGGAGATCRRSESRPNVTANRRAGDRPGHAGLRHWRPAQDHLLREGRR